MADSDSEINPIHNNIHNNTYSFDMEFIYYTNNLEKLIKMFNMLQSDYRIYGMLNTSKCEDFIAIISQNLHFN